MNFKGSALHGPKLFCQYTTGAVNVTKFEDGFQVKKLLPDEIEMVYQVPLKMSCIGEDKCFCENGTTKAGDGEIMSMDEFIASAPPPKEKTPEKKVEEEAEQPAKEGE